LIIQANELLIQARELANLRASSLLSNLQCLNVRFGSKADIGDRLDDVRFTPKSGHC
jgi:hypothetical protein